jgi:DnaA regulatory inactivator Hda
MRQLVLSLDTSPRYAFNNLIVHEGIEDALSTVKKVYGTRSLPLPFLFLYGPPGTGKTHLLRALADLVSGGAPAESLQVPFIEPTDEHGDFPGLPALVSELEDRREVPAGVAVDDLHLVNPEESVHLWSLSNKLTRTGAPLLVTSRRPPGEVFQDDTHLSSRLTSGLVLGLEPPDDGVRMLILDKIACDRNLRISTEVCRYLVTRKSRNVKDLQDLLALLDLESLRHKRRITLPFIKLLEKEKGI